MLESFDEISKSWNDHFPEYPNVGIAICTIPKRQNSYFIGFYKLRITNLPNVQKFDGLICLISKC